jgi:hypothetical protein
MSKPLISKPRNLLRVLTERGPLIVLAAVIAMLFGIVVPASAQFFPFGQQQPRRQYLPPPQPQPQQQQRPFFGDFFAPFGQPSAPPQRQQAPQPRVDYSRAPPPKADKDGSPSDRYVLVLGDAMADWLAYGLEDALSEQPDLGVIRKHRTVSGLLRYQPRGEPSDWAAAAKGIIAHEPSDLIVVMLGLHDRAAIREAAVDKSDSKKKTDTKPGAKPEDAEAPPADEQADNGETPSIAAPERTTRAANGVNEFRSERWTELYKKKIDDMIGVLKTKNVPVVWVGLPALRGPKATSDMLFLNSLYREAAAKAGITYVDVWDGFVDEGGRFMQQGPDFEGQTRRLRTADGVFFTRPGARKLAHYVDREIKRLLSNRAVPVALPSDPGTPDTSIRPGGPAPRPLAGPIVPLVAPMVSTTELLGGAGSPPTTVDALAARTLVKGEPLNAPSGRADDFSWPRREIGKLDGKDETPVATGKPATTGAAPAADAAPPKPVKRRPRPPVANTEQGNWPGFSGQRRPLPPPSYRPAPPRPPAPVGRSASAPGFFSNPFTR